MVLVRNYYKITIRLTTQVLMRTVVWTIGCYRASRVCGSVYVLCDVKQ